MFYDLSFKMPNGKDLPLSDFKAKVVMIVNVASKCGFTKQYESLQRLYDEYKDKGFVIIGVPSNDFGQQEPGNNEEIQKFCKINYNITFPIVAKEVVTGASAHPFYIEAKKTLGFGTSPKWNFHKYLINKEGVIVDYFNSPTSPEAPRVKKAIEKCL